MTCSTSCSHVRRQGIARSFSLRCGGWRGSWMRTAGDRTRRRRLNKLSCAGWVPHDRGSVLGLPRSRIEHRSGVTAAESDDGRSTMIITAPIRLQQRGQEMRLVFGGEDGLPNGNTGLIRLLARAHSIRRSLFDDRMTIGEIARAEDLIPSYVTRLVRMTFLAPDITASILSGRHDPDLTVSRLMADTRFPLDWNDQRRFFASA